MHTFTTFLHINPNFKTTSMSSTIVPNALQEATRIKEEEKLRQVSFPNCMKTTRVQYPTTAGPMVSDAIYKKRLPFQFHKIWYVGTICKK